MLLARSRSASELLPVGRNMLAGVYCLAVALQPRECRAQIEQRAGVLDIELERSPKRLQRFGVALIVEQRASQKQQGVEVVRILLEHLRETDDSAADAARAAQQIGERQRRLVKRGQRLERLFVRAPGLLPFLVLLVQPPELEPHLHEALI